MFKKIDSKIKVIAVLNFIIGLIAAFAGLIVLISDSSYIVGLVLIIFGIISIFASWILYGFGVLIEKVCNISDRVTLMSQNKGITDAQVAEFKPKEQKGYIANELNPFDGCSALNIPKREKGGKKDDN